MLVHPNANVVEVLRGSPPIGSRRNPALRYQLVSQGQAWTDRRWRSLVYVSTQWWATRSFALEGPGFSRGI